jgi:hypothetical protein
MMAAQFNCGDVPYRFKFDYLAPELQPVTSFLNPSTPTVNPTKTYNSATAEGIQYDVLWVPAGISSDALICLRIMNSHYNFQDLCLILPQELIGPQHLKLPSSKLRLRRQST